MRIRVQVFLPVPSEPILVSSDDSRRIKVRGYNAERIIHT